MKKIPTNTLKIIILGFGFLIVLTVLLFGYQDIPIEELKKKYTDSYSSFVRVGGMEVHYRDQGKQIDSTPIVLIHGTGSSLHTYDHWTKELAMNHRVIRMDLPGYGLTGPFSNRDYSYKNYVIFLKDFLKSIGIKKCILAGNSLGGNIAWRFTNEYSEMVEKLILIDAAGYPMKSKSIPLAFKIAQIPVIQNIFTFITPRFVAKASVENVYKNKTKVDEELVDRYFELTLRKGNRQAFVDRFKVKSDTISHKKIKLINQRTLILWGEEDELIPSEMAYLFHDNLPDDTLVILKNVGHVPMEESPSESLMPVIEFLRK
ncbi:alpha/beta hydrolase [Flavobacteriales bacterium]|nr:alpha/beta hydrolase [Flavobacteriales bacterium]